MLLATNHFKEIIVFLPSSVTNQYEVINFYFPFFNLFNSTAPFKAAEWNSNFSRMFAKHRQLRPFFQHRQWSHFDDPWWDYPVFPRMSMYEHPFNSGIETSVIPHDTSNVAGFSEVINNENEFKVSLTTMFLLTTNYMVLLSMHKDKYGTSQMKRTTCSNTSSLLI